MIIVILITNVVIKNGKFISPKLGLLITIYSSSAWMTFKPCRIAVASRLAERFVSLS